MQAQMETWERLRDLNEYVQTSLSAFNQLPQGNKVASNLLKNVLMENEQSREDFQKARSNVLETTDLLQEIRSALEEEMKRKQNKELQRLRQRRTKKKANVDTKASKGRKTRYVTIDKLVNFFPATPEQIPWPHEKRDELFKSLFTS
ncbi:apoptosis antagonizing transcription factor domain-containing protein [Ditylenchus destructor]|uniref:Apoptosis antagonizing transcription factor domain-containing protein n=1 Tax=Ditylenchus destructor TaxID=166010 RepID=A0AAD4RB57_9BILA|nr:apoptosis antagonizing transcription factor domain-containing protein [Ditylenchus destructor]